MIARSKKAMQMTTTTEKGTYSGACPFRRLGGCFGGIRCGPGCGIATGFESINTAANKTQRGAMGGTMGGTQRNSTANNDPWRFSGKNTKPAPKPAPAPAPADDDDSLISNSEFDEIMSILKKNRG